MTKVEKGLLHFSVLMNVGMFVWIFLYGIAGITLKPKAIEIVGKWEGSTSKIALSTMGWGPQLRLYVENGGNYSGVEITASASMGQINVQRISEQNDEAGILLRGPRPLENNKLGPASASIWHKAVGQERVETSLIEMKATSRSESK